MARTTTTGEVTAAKAMTPTVTAAGPSGLMHVGVALESFGLPWNGQLVTFHRDQRITVETAQKVAIQATDRNVSWES